jgi:hypothetical protein
VFAYVMKNKWVMPRTVPWTALRSAIGLMPEEPESGAVMKDWELKEKSGYYILRSSRSEPLIQ